MLDRSRHELQERHNRSHLEVRGTAYGRKQCLARLLRTQPEAQHRLRQQARQHLREVEKTHQSATSSAFRRATMNGNWQSRRLKKTSTLGWSANEQARTLMTEGSGSGSTLFGHAYAANISNDPQHAQQVSFRSNAKTLHTSVAASVHFKHNIITISTKLMQQPTNQNRRTTHPLPAPKQLNGPHMLAHLSRYGP
jgi:hypothetical protein